MQPSCPGCLAGYLQPWPYRDSACGRGRSATERNYRLEFGERVQVSPHTPAASAGSLDSASLCAQYRMGHALTDFDYGNLRGANPKLTLWSITSRIVDAHFLRERRRTTNTWGILPSLLLRTLATPPSHPFSIVICHTELTLDQHREPRMSLTSDVAPTNSGCFDQRNIASMLAQQLYPTTGHDDANNTRSTIS
ncbi:hypothetical protein PHLGIDRAFT_443266 [Phlebiopsis gigantea 11061_1 CR5-6]|uniref:Uncharacterized protein n=1 Tax=Phlebiopsis gigantea (strain 11061_1 CR5-6) TaxID=745531 RepID=A0A0C3S7P8_PHLG1|nr:hypothetical protein PHLGIDRAFT_443266 [Phlebiopsis gigantea 11061_1 CR5-6]